MSEKNLLAKVEALLFVAGDVGFDLKQLSKTLKISLSELYEALQNLDLTYRNNCDSALRVRELGGRFVLTTKEQFGELLQKYANTAEANYLSKAALETLAIIAYRQPIARAQIDEIRGVNSSGMMQRLASYNLIVEKGRMEAPGRPIIYGTTPYFLNYFGLKSLSELPEIGGEVDIESAQENLLFKHYEGEKVNSYRR